MEPENLEDLVQDSRALALNDVPYDRDLRWCNKPSKARPRPQPNTSNRLFNQIVSITHNTEEYERLDKHYKELDQRKARYDSAAPWRERGRGKTQRTQPRHRNAQRSEKDAREEGEGRSQCSSVVDSDAGDARDLQELPPATSLEHQGLNPDAPIFVPAFVRR